MVLVAAVLQTCLGGIFAVVFVWLCERVARSYSSILSSGSSYQEKKSTSRVGLLVDVIIPRTRNMFVPTHITFPKKASSSYDIQSSKKGSCDRIIATRFLLAWSLWIAAWIYFGFAMVGESQGVHLQFELFGVVVYGILAVLGLKRSQYWLALGWLLHPVWDVLLHEINSVHALLTHLRTLDFLSVDLLAGILNPAVFYTPHWYPMLCVGFDLYLGFYIAVHL